MDYKNITSKLRKPVQFICAEISIRYRDNRNAGQVLDKELNYWVKEILDGQGEYDKDGYLKTPFLTVRCKGTKEECQIKASAQRTHAQMHRSTSRLEQLGLWGTSWRVLPADENGNWVPSTGAIKKALAVIEAS